MNDQRRARPVPTPRHLGVLLVVLTLAWVAVLASLARGEEIGWAASTKPKPSIYLKVYASPIVAPSKPQLGGAAVEVKAEIVGQLIEAWYCPEVVFIFPDTTKSTHESDCVVWEEAYLEGAKPEMRWSSGLRVYPAGDWPVVVELRKAGKLITAQTAIVRVAD